MGMSDILQGRLFQGSFPPCGAPLRARGFSLLVLAARELQPPDQCYPGVRIVRVPLDDNPRLPPNAHEVEQIMKAAADAANIVRRGGKVLITCAAGWNRSGLITATALRYLGMSGAQATAHVQARREDALINPAFVAFLKPLPPLGVAHVARTGVG